MSGAELIAFVQAQLDADEHAATAYASELHTVKCGYDQIEWSSDCACGTPARVLAEIAAKRAILVEAIGQPQDFHYAPMTAVKIIQLMAQPYAGRPGFRDEWTVQA